MRVVVVLFFVAIVALAANSAVAADFRDTSWGMTLSEVLAQHPGEIPADQRIGFLTYESKLANFDVKIFYRFDDEGALIQAGYDITADPELRESIVTDYQQLNQLLRKRYPHSDEPEQSWVRQTFKDQPEHWDRAVRLGHVTYLWQHSVPGTSIEHSLKGNRRKIDHVLLYQAVEQVSEQGVLDQL